MRIIYQIIGIVILCAHPTVIYSQKNFSIPDTKEITINHKDSTIKSYVRLVGSKMDIDNNIFYYWYETGKINVNKGGFAGKLLHGKYFVFYKDEKLKTQGFFVNGI